MADGGGRCPLCGEPNAHSRAYCRRCRYRLPWADHAEDFTAARGELIKGDSPNLQETLPDSSPALLDQLTARKNWRGHAVVTATSRLKRTRRTVRTAKSG